MKNIYCTFADTNYDVGNIDLTLVFCDEAVGRVKCCEGGKGYSFGLIFVE